MISALQRRFLDELDDADSAAGLAARLGLPRQKVNYHLRELERDGLVELVEERQKRGFVERRLRSTARDRFSSAYLARVASRLADDVTALRQAAADVDRPLLTLTAESEIRFESPAALETFARDLARVFAKHDRPDLRRSHAYRVVVGVHP